MAIGRTFEESLQKALRMTDPAVGGWATSVPTKSSTRTSPCLRRRIFASRWRCSAATRSTRSTADGHRPWFLYKIERISR